MRGGLRLEEPSPSVATLRCWTALVGDMYELVFLRSGVPGWWLWAADAGAMSSGISCRLLFSTAFLAELICSGLDIQPSGNEVRFCWRCAARLSVSKLGAFALVDLPGEVSGLGLTGGDSLRRVSSARRAAA